MDNGHEVYIDVEDGLRRVGGNMNLFKRLLGIFVGSDQLAPIAGPLEAGDFAEAARAVHALKGMSANLSMKRLYSVSAALENQLKNGTDHSELFEELKDVLRVTLDRVNEI